MQDETLQLDLIKIICMLSGERLREVHELLHAELANEDGEITSLSLSSSSEQKDMEAAYQEKADLEEEEEIITEKSKESL